MRIKRSVAEIVFFLVAAVVLMASAQASSRGELWRFGNERVRVVEAGGLVVSEGCVLEGGSSCKAIDALERARERGSNLDPRRLSGGVNPGSILCARLGGQVAIGEDAERNQNAFCVFEDHSMISCSSLFSAVEQRR